ncbi:helix-turn-helix transcriptional regulator [Paraconexibacter antarcticus]|uniref:Helix-turn-helix transcriptional regulator n=1 Tax=Paraconexibacter antarcticus TaxID=2949664 RepID=A0ABY5DQJ5_9ACTN|nr:helix-turn-helix transcriptional regulator [Paraconexibacter antarcticus]UTI64298.1 helix-turn-helix transcriptional regulator [Paraconexibacter antarcticus]
MLGLLEQAGEATPYDLKKMAEPLSDLWSLRHDQVYREPERLAAAGLLAERREESGRRRRRFVLTDAGRAALARWRETPTTEFTQLRDEALLQLLFGAPTALLADAQVELHGAKLAEYEALRDTFGPDSPLALRQVVNAGIGHEREWLRFWGSVRDGGDGA